MGKESAKWGPRHYKRRPKRLPRTRERTFAALSALFCRDHPSVCVRATRSLAPGI
ncbi:hypothetical protein FA13DRAFT_1728907 [Coprinellus micaceus]|uniref:Uncharacterized protein n=1 Tax=Coprinellus micaceus TaxID=71717 RepID=A0A4Y7TMC7_COPMI|nr:hypothetical protein FA13DRAFT_1728907 [Coprinellus micaceus]